jgi:hypothetical protein
VIAAVKATGMIPKQMSFRSPWQNGMAERWVGSCRRDLLDHIVALNVQYKRNPARCQFTTVLGVTNTRGFFHPDQNILNATQNSLCRAVNRRRGRCACRASNCRRRARFSRTRSSRERKALTIQPRRCRSDTIIAGILSEKSESSFPPSHSFCECTTFWRGTPLFFELYVLLFMRWRSLWMHL